MKDQHFRLVNEAVRGNALAAVRAAEIGGDSVLVVRIETEEKKRTQRQNRYLWGVVYKTIVDNDPGFFGNEETTETLRAAGLSMQDAVHEYCKRVFLPGETLWLSVGETGDFGEDFFVRKSTRKLSRREFNEYVEDIRRWAADSLQVFIPDPAACGYEDLVWRGK